MLRCRPGGEEPSTSRRSTPDEAAAGAATHPGRHLKYLLLRCYAEMRTSWELLEVEVEVEGAGRRVDRRDVACGQAMAKSVRVAGTNVMHPVSILALFYTLVTGIRES